ncbi:MAG: ribosomal L7Ae/L30e/S12e/Gadd45 family protein [Bacillota bacterium]
MGYLRKVSLSRLEEMLSNSGNKVVGTKQTIKALEKNEAQKVFIARDAEEKVTRPVISLCEESNIEVYYIESMEQLGKLCGIKVKAAVAAIKENKKEVD